MAYRIKEMIQSDEKIIVTFSHNAYKKMFLYVDECPYEIAMHGLIERTSDMSFYIEDVFLFPQNVTGGSVNVDEGKYALWMAQTYNTPERMIKNRMHIHSHVNMHVAPSGTDEGYRDEQMQNICAGSDSWYLFMIVNKRRLFTAELYDYKNMVVWETGDISIVKEKKKPGSHTCTKAGVKKEMKDMVTYTGWKARTALYGGTPNTLCPDVWHNYNYSAADYGFDYWYDYEPRYDSSGFAGDQLKFKLNDTSGEGRCVGCKAEHDKRLCQTRRKLHSTAGCYYHQAQAGTRPLAEDEDF